MTDDERASAKLAKQIEFAIDRFLRRFIVPILQKADDDLYLGTGTLFQVGGWRYLVTAQHVVGDEDPSSLLVPAMEPNLRNLGPLSSFAAEPSDDVALIGLNEDTCSDLVAGGHDFVTVGNLSGVSGEEQAFLVPGPTCSTTRVVGKNIGGRFNMFLTPLYDGPDDELKEPVDLKVDLFLRHTNTVGTLQDTDEETPGLKGISGTSVWAVLARDVAGPERSPESQLRLVAIETACKPGSYIRAKKWHVVAKLLRELDAAAAAQVFAALELPPRGRRN